MIKRLLKQDWDAIAGILAAITALILHLLHVTDVDTLMAIAIVLMALLLIRDFRRENEADTQTAALERAIKLLKEVKFSLHPAEVTLIGPTELTSASLEFAQKAQGDVVLFNVCLRMYKAQQPFDIMFKPFIENPLVKSMQLVLNTSEKERCSRTFCLKLKPARGSKKC